MSMEYLMVNSLDKPCGKAPTEKRRIVGRVAESWRHPMAAVPRPAPSVISLAEYAHAWLERTAARVRPQSAALYAWILQHYVLPVLGGTALDALTKVDVIDLVDAVLARGLSPASARGAHATLSALLTDAVDRDVLAVNVALRLPRTQRKRLRSTVRPSGAYTERQLALFLETAATIAPELHGLYLAMGKGGLRIGEAIGLQGGDVNWPDRQLTIRRTVRMGGRVGPPKNGKPRTIDLAESLRKVLAIRVQQAHPWIFPGRWPTEPIGYTKARTTQRDIATTAGLPDVGPHGLRRSYASILISRGVPAEYLRRQLGHSPSTDTIRHYGAFLPMERPPLLDAI
jgi:integrase